MSCKKTRLTPGGIPNKEVQKKFVRLIIRTAKKAEKEGSEIVFADPTHQVHNTVNGYAWQLKGLSETKIIQSASGRKRITILGALNPNSLKVTTLITEGNCDQEMVMKHLEELRQDHQNAKKIYLFWDNARYHWSKKVRQKAKSLNIILIYLPAYSPNLNLIERLWKFLKKKIRRNIYYDTFKKFKKAIFEFFKNIEHYKDELKKLLTLKFEII